MRDLLRISDVLERYQITRTTLARWVRVGRFPQPMNPGGGQPRWQRIDIEKHEAEAEAERKNRDFVPRWKEANL